MKVKLNPNYFQIENYPDLTPEKIYSVIGIEADDFRILNEKGQPYLYPQALFWIVDKQIPSDWKMEYGEEGESYAYPEIFQPPGFFEDYFDGEQYAINTFHQYFKKNDITSENVTELALAG